MQIPLPFRFDRFVRMAPTASVSLMILLTTLAGCLTDGGEQSPESERIFDWEIGEWWSYEVTGSLPAPWMDSHQIGWGRELGHEMSWPTSLNVTLMANPDEILPNDPYMQYLSAYGLPLATEWDIGRGVTLGAPLVERYNRDGATIRGTQFIGWPLEDGKSWETRFMGRDLNITAVRVGDDFQMVARDGEEVLLRYVLDMEQRWFSSFEIMDGGGGIQAKATLLEHGLEGYTGEVYEFANGSYAIWCTGGAGPLPASPGSCGVGSLSIMVHPGGRSEFFHHHAYRSTGPGVQTVTHGTPDEEVQVANSDDCPCDEDRYWRETVEDPGRYWWEINDFFSGDDRWQYFSVYYACQTVYKMEGDDLQVVDACEP